MINCAPLLPARHKCTLNEPNRSKLFTSPETVKAKSNKQATTFVACVRNGEVVEERYQHQKLYYISKIPCVAQSGYSLISQSSCLFLSVY